MNEINIEREIDIVALLKRIMKRWKSIVLAFICCALIGGLLNYKKAFKTEKVKVKVEETQEVTEKSREVVEEKENENDYISKTKESLNNLLIRKMDYINNSKFGAIGSGISYTARAIYINSEINNGNEFIGGTDDQDANDKACEYLAKYLGNLKGTVFKYDELVDEIGVKNASYMPELIGISAQGNTIIIDVTLETEEKANMLLDVALAQIDKAIEDSKGDFGNASFHLINRGTRLNNNSKATWLPSQMTEVDNIVKAITNLEKNEELIRKVFNDGEDILKEDEKVVEETPAEIEETVTVTKFEPMTLIKNSIMYGCAGAFAYALLLGILLIMKGKVISGNEISSIYGLSPLASISKTDIDNDYRLARGEIKTLHPDSKNIAIIGDVSEESLNKVYDNLSSDSSINYKTITDLANSIDARNMLGECDGAILVTKTEESTHPHISNLIKYAKDRKVDVIGYIDIL